MGVHSFSTALTPLDSLPDHSREEIEWLVGAEHVATLADLVLRRMTVAFSGELSLAAIEELSAIAAPTLGWDEPMRLAQVAGLLEILERDHGLTAAELRSRNPDGKDKDVRREESPHEPAVRQRQVS